MPQGQAKNGKQLLVTKQQQSKVMVKTAAIATRRDNMGTVSQKGQQQQQEQLL